MNRKFLRRYLKLLPRRLARADRLGPLLFLLCLSLFSVVYFYRLPSPPPPPATAFRPPGLPSSAVSPSPQPLTPASPPPPVSATHVLILHPPTQTVIFQKNADEPVYPASTTKIMTALVALEHFSLNQSLSATRSYSLEQKPNFIPGEQISVESLLYALLVQSANDAAEILAENFPGGRPAFIAAMNAKAADLNLRQTRFQNPTGLDEPGHTSTAADLARLAQAAIRNSLLSRIVSTENAVITSQDRAQTHVLTNTNELLGKVPGVLGGKTGFTDLAGQSLITLVERRSLPLLFIVLGSTDRFAETRTLIEWAYSSLP